LARHPRLSGGGAASRQAWEASYPLAYRRLVEHHGRQSGAPDHSLYAIMRKESGFDPREVSYANAIGLFQMLPATSRIVAERLGIADHGDDRIFDPEYNIRIAAWYIGRLYRKFGAQLPLAAAAFNGGPAAMMRWCQRFGRRPMDEFVELIPFHQTREYAKRTTAIYARYRFLYARDLYLPPLEADPEFAQDDIDF
jgi:soluble lytic murein transglycosylase